MQFNAACFVPERMMKTNQSGKNKNFLFKKKKKKRRLERLSPSHSVFILFHWDPVRTRVNISSELLPACQPWCRSPWWSLDGWAVV